MILEWHLLFKIIIRICKKMFAFCRKPLKLLSKSCLFIFCILFWRGVNPSIKSEEICGALRDLVPFVQFKKREKYPWRSVNFSKVAGFSKNIIQLHIIITSKTPEKSSQVILHFYHFCLDADQIFKNKSRCKNFNLDIVTSNKPPWKL